jgi:hypothetical protein
VAEVSGEGAAMKTIRRADGSTGYPCERGHVHHNATAAMLCDLSSGGRRPARVEAGVAYFENAPPECVACGRTLEGARCRECQEAKNA